MANFAANSVLLVMAALPAFGQLDAYTLHSRYGAPLDRETFTVRPGIEMVVDYGPSTQVCRIQLPSGMQFVGAVPEGAVTKKQIDEVLNEVIPLSIRGKELNRMWSATGAFAVSSVIEYEHVTIAELQVGGVGRGITVTFKDDGCQHQAAP